MEAISHWQFIFRLNWRYYTDCWSEQ